MAAVIKKLIVMVLTNPKFRKAVFGIILGVIVIAIMPFLALYGIFSGEIKIDTNRLTEMVVENMTEEERKEMQHINDTMYGIENQMLAKGYSQEQVQQAQLLYMTTLDEESKKEHFIETLVGCFQTEQTDAELIQNVNRTFGLSINKDDFTQIMDGIRSVAIDTSDYYDKSMKNNLDLVKYAKHAKEAGWGYVWGTYGQILTDARLESLINQYPKDVGKYEDFIRKHWLGKRATDCGGLIKGYAWLNVETNQIEYGTNGMPVLRADGIYAEATEKGPINTIPEIPGLAVWKKGHIGVYIGNGKVIEAMSTKKGVVETNLSEGPWTHWLKVPHITYIETEE